MFFLLKGVDERIDGIQAKNAIYPLELLFLESDGRTHKKDVVLRTSLKTTERSRQRVNVVISSSNELVTVVTAVTNKSYSYMPL